MAIWRRFVIALGVVIPSLFFPLVAETATTGQYYWCDVRTGYAMGGFDPVAYFVDKKPRVGKTEFEYDWQNVTWRFVSAANRAVFVRDPKVYAPQFGGYGAEATAKGVLTEGSPTVWLIYRDRLYLFAGASQRMVWVDGPKFRRSKAVSNWDVLSKSLVRD